jgi:hypothetical protein
MALEVAQTTWRTSNWPAGSYVATGRATVVAASEESGDGAADIPERVHDGGQHDKEPDEQQKGSEEVFRVSDHCGDPPTTSRYVYVSPFHRNIANFAPSDCPQSPPLWHDGGGRFFAGLAPSVMSNFSGRRYHGQRQLRPHLLTRWGTRQWQR